MYYVVALVLKSYFRVSQCIVISFQGMNIFLKVRRISLSKNIILRALEANRDIPSLHEYPRAHQVRESTISLSSAEPDLKSGDVQILLGHAGLFERRLHESKALHLGL